MKKQTFLHKLTNWLAALGFAAVCGCLAVVNNKIQKADAYTVQKAQQSVTFTKEELNNCGYTYLTTTDEDLENSYIIMNNIRYDYDSDVGNYWVNENQEYNIGFHKGLDDINGFNLFDENDIYIPFTYGMTMYSSFFAENMQKSITLSASQLNNNTYEYFANYLVNEGFDNNYQLGYVISNNLVYTFNDFTASDSLLYYNESNEYYIRFDMEEYHWYWQDINGLASDEPFTNSITIYSTYIADNLYAPADGDDIVPAIASGLGLIQYLAQTFLGGFTGLWWQNNALTNFAIYCCVMLGVAIVFSIIKLCMAIMRSNTGA